jgi:hypothetical protein
MGSHTITGELSLSQLCWKSFPSSLLAFNLNSEHNSTSTRIVLALSRTHSTCTVKKGLPFSCPQPGCHLPNSPWTGIIKLFPSRESLVSDIQAGDGKIVHLFLQCTGPLAITYLLSGWYAELCTDAGKSERQPTATRNRLQPPTPTSDNHQTALEN